MTIVNVTDLPSNKFDHIGTPQELVASQALSPSNPWVSTGIRKYDALYRWWGAANGGVSFNKSTSLSTLNFTQTGKIEVEAPYVSARLMWVNVGINELADCKALVGTTETNATGTSTEIGSPNIGGTAYQAVAAADSIDGWRQVSWSGSDTVAVPASTARQSVAISDSIPITPVPRADNGSRPLFLYRAHHNGGASGAFPFVTTTANHRVATEARRGRTLVLSANTSTDGVTTPTTTMALNTIALEVFPIIRHTTPVLSVWSAGDSLVQNDALVEDKISTWVERACLQLSTQDRPIVHANFGASSNGAAVYLDAMAAALEAGAPSPSVLIFAPVSIIDITATPNLRIEETIVASAMKCLDLAETYGIPVIIWFQALPRQDLDAAGDTIRIRMNSTVENIAEKYGIPFLKWPELSDQAAPERWVVRYQGSGSHPNELAIETVMAPLLTKVLSNL